MDLDIDKVTSSTPWLVPSGTELELQWGRNLQAALSHKSLRDSGGGASDVAGTEATLTYRISSALRLQLHLARLAKPTLLLQYSSYGAVPSSQ